MASSEADVSELHQLTPPRVSGDGNGDKLLASRLNVSFSSALTRDACITAKDSGLHEYWPPITDAEMSNQASEEHDNPTESPSSDISIAQPLKQLSSKLLWSWSAISKRWKLPAAIGPQGTWKATPTRKRFTVLE